VGKVALEVGGDPIVIEQGIIDVEQKDDWGRLPHRDTSM